MLNPKDPNYLDLCDEYRKQSKEGNGMERTAVGHPWEVRGQEIYDANGIWVGEVNVPDRIVRAVNRDHVFDALVEALESVLRDDGVVWGQVTTPTIEKAQAALAQVKGEQT